MTKRVGGSSPSLSRSGIQRVLRWHRALNRFKEKQGTLASFSKSLGLTVWELRRALKRRSGGLSLNSEQKKRIARWKARKQRVEKQHPSARQLAQSLGVSRSTLFLCLEKKGLYRTSRKSEQPSSQRLSAIQANAVLLRAWGLNTADRLKGSNRVKSPRTRKRGAA